jgi:hypothetical protein
MTLILGEAKITWFAGLAAPPATLNNASATARHGATCNGMYHCTYMHAKSTR